MRTPCLTLVAFAALGAAALRAQTSAGSSQPYIPPPPAQDQPVNPPPANPPPGPPAAYPWGYHYGPEPATRLAGSIDFPYASNWDALGVSGELGALRDGRHFLGGEIAYYGSDYKTYDVFNGATFLGRFRSAQRVTTVEAAYRYLAPLWDAGGGRVPVSFYVGGGLGAGFVDHTDNGGAFGFRGTTNGALALEGVAGIEVNSFGGAALRLGFRYLDLADVWQFNHRGDLDSGAFEAGASFRF